MLTDDDLVTWHVQLEEALSRFADSDLRPPTARIAEPAVHEAAAAHLLRPSKRRLGMAFLQVAHVLDCDQPTGDLVRISTALEIRHAAILLHPDISNGDFRRSGHATAHQVVHSVSATEEAGSTALFASEILAGLAPLPILRSGLPAAVRSRLCQVFQDTTAPAAVSRAEKLHLEPCQDAVEITDGGLRARCLLCCIQLAGTLAQLDALALTRVCEAGVLHIGRVAVELPQRNLPS
ncbi:hypothetical protein AB0H07_47180 [Streptomyces sp. NPDC021354]|uniref:hypothetical protein n=1 Tax=Streptomyces sp. NPDC021354 TaxID=3154793 RepID=UPI0033CDE462